MSWRLVVVVGCATACSGPVVPDDVLDADDDGIVDAEDCAPADAGVFPGAIEVCDGVDQDCDGVVDDEATDATPWFGDVDGDGYGAGEPILACEPPAGAVAAAGDCNDAAAGVFPGNPERCDGLDADCDPSTDDAGLIDVDGVAFTDLHAAIAAAPAGATVLVCAGDWPAITIGHDLVLRALSGPDATRIVGDGGPAVAVTAGDVTVEGFTITGGAGAPQDEGRVGGGVSATNAAALRVVGSVIVGNGADVGGGIAGPASGPLVVEGTRIADNTATVRGGGVFGADVTLDAVELVGNQAGDGGGVAVPADGRLSAADTAFSSNQAGGSGGAIAAAAGAEVALFEVGFDGDRAGRYGGAVYLASGGAIAATDVTFDNEASVDKGGALYVFEGHVALTDTRVIGCQGSWGGAAFLYDTAFEADQVELSYNTAELGGALYVYLGSVASLSRSTVTGNVAEAGGGARLRTEAALASDATDWGAGDGENLPDDVDVSKTATYKDFGSSSSFSCDTASGGCASR